MWARVDEQNAPKKSKKPSQASDGPLGESTPGLHSTRVFDSWPASKKQAPRSVRCLARLHRVTLDQGIVHETRDQAPNRGSGQNFHHHISSYVLRVDGARRVREALLLRSGLGFISGVERALLGRSFFSGGRRWLHVRRFLAGDLLGLEMSGAARELQRTSTGRLRGSTKLAQRSKSV